MSFLDLKSHSGTENFSRYEFKYVIDKDKSDLIEKEIQNFMNYDGHVHPELKNSYYVCSLYFDNDDAEHYYEKIDGIRYRRKFRLRTYGKEYEEGLPIYLEEKGRYIDRTYKERIKIPLSQLSIFCSQKRHHELLNLYPDHDLVSRFVYDSMRKRVKPKVLVDYIRRPYTCSFDMNFRVTFDFHLMAANTKALFPSNTINWKYSNNGKTILEVKFHRRIPSWFHRIIQIYNMRRVSISKFCKGMEVTDLAENLS